MSGDDAFKIYLSVSFVYLVTRIFKLIRKTDGVSGWSSLRREAIDSGFPSELFAPFATLTLLICTTTWPIRLIEFLIRANKPKGKKP